jgi:peptidoglycan/LPS O-acetylase OafA/YrhL
MAGRWIVSLPARIGRPPTRATYIPQIDGLRFLAIFVVLLWHISLRCARHVDFLNANGSPVVGTMCYSIYLVHVVVIEALARLLRWLPLCYLLILGPACLCASAVFYVVVERPFMTASPIVPSSIGRLAFIRRRG